MAEIDKPKGHFFLSEKEIEKWTGYWHAQRMMLVSGKLNTDSLQKATLELRKLDYMSSDPITLMIESGGGDSVPTLQFEDMISAMNSPVDALVIGDCASGGVDIVQMCRTRMMLPSARMLVHYVRHEQRWIGDDVEQLDNDIKYFRERMLELAERRLALYVRRTAHPVEQIKKMFRHGEVHSSYFSAKQAIELGLADKIITNFKMFPKKPKEEKK